MAKISTAGQHQAVPSTAPGRTARVTRSQSVEPQPAPTAPGRATRDSRRMDSSKIDAPLSKRNRQRPVVASADLSPVEEDDLSPNDQLQVGESDVDDDRVRRVSAGSGLSGTTAKTSFSQEEVDELDHEVMVDLLPGLAAAFEGLARLLAPAGSDTPSETWKEIRRTGSKHHKLYSNRLATIAVHKPSFGSQEYIQPSIVLRALLGVKSMTDVPPAIWRPDNVIFVVNLTQLLHSILILCDPNQWNDSSLDALKRLDACFPSTIAGSEYSPAALEFSLNVSTQLAIARLEAEQVSPGFLPYDLIDDVLYDADGEYKHAPALALDTTTAREREDALDMVAQLMETLKTAFANAKDPRSITVAIGNLKSMFRWSDLRNHALRYYVSRKNLLDERIKAAGGISQITNSLVAEIERRRDIEYATEVRTALKKPGSTPRTSLGGQNALASLIEREKALAKQQYLAPVAPMTANQMIQPDLDVPPPPSDEHLDEPDELFVPIDDLQSTARSTFAALSGYHQKQTVQQSRAQSALNEQYGALVRHDEQPAGSPELGGPIASRLPRSSTLGKRPYVEEEPGFEPTQDEGFQIDIRDQRSADMRRREVSFGPPTQQTPPGPLMQYPSSSGAPVPTTSLPSPRPSKRPRQNPGSLIPPTTQPASGDAPQSTFYARAKAAAKQNRVLPTQPKRQQVRRPWTGEEEEALIDYIEEYCDLGAISYAELKNIDRDLEEHAKLSRRTAEDIRFKARIMKVTMLRSGSGLPKNWEKVVLDRKAIDQLETLGIEYHQERIRGFSAVGA